MDIDKIIQLATPILEKNDFGVSHTQRVYNIAKEHFPINPEHQDLTYASIILHDIGGCTIKRPIRKRTNNRHTTTKTTKQPPRIHQSGREIIATHHDHPDNPTEPFQTVYDADKLVMLTPQEYPHYNVREGFDWNKIVSLIYSKKEQEIAKTWLAQRKNETQ